MQIWLIIRLGNVDGRKGEDQRSPSGWAIVEVLHRLSEEEAGRRSWRFGRHPAQSRAAWKVIALVIVQNDSLLHLLKYFKIPGVVYLQLGIILYGFVIR